MIITNRGDNPSVSANNQSVRIRSDAGPSGTNEGSHRDE